MAIDNKKRVRDNGDMNWPKLIQDLVDSGLTQVQIAESCQTGQSHISALLNGSRKCPNWALGEALRNLHAEKVGAGGTAGNSGQSVE